jgi:hypothetical protein
MPAFDRRRFASIVALFVAVGILGYVIGHDRARVASSGASGATSRTISAAGTLLAYPADWQPATATPQIPGLPIADPVVLAPDGDAAHAGLIAGQLPGDEPSLLPRGFIARMRSLPETEVVSLVETQGYRYAHLSVDGFDRMLVLYGIPHPNGSPTVLACYASAAFSAEMRTCEQIVARLTLVGQQPNYDPVPEPSYDLIPEARYARVLSAAIEALEVQRVSSRREMGAGAPPHTVQRLATRLAAGFANTAASLSQLKPSLATGQAQGTLSQSLLRARDAYTALAAAATSESPSRVADAQRRVSEAEASINTALESFALLGYRT